ncbi:MAG TPA: hypothetical protein VFE57_01530 [Cyclobacteriaceae bacterium]|jgi:competence protein ComGC|nr:hypothetical protein [Cyclobacteriaceae bacterium]
MKKLVIISLSLCIALFSITTSAQTKTKKPCDKQKKIVLLSKSDSIAYLFKKMQQQEALNKKQEALGKQLTKGLAENSKADALRGKGLKSHLDSLADQNYKATAQLTIEAKNKTDQALKQKVGFSTFTLVMVVACIVGLVIIGALFYMMRQMKNQSASNNSLWQKSDEDPKEVK